jgi:hypothetical protein
MKIQSRTRRYIILARLREGDRRSLYAARDAEGASYLLLLTKGEEDLPRMVGLYRNLEGNGLFTDFIESFPHVGGICGVFVSHLGRYDKALEDFAAEASPQLRLAALRSLVAGFIAQGMSFEVICDLLRADNLFCSSHGEVHFVYDLGVFALQESSLASTALARLASTIQMVVSPDLLSEAMQTLCTALEGARFSSLDEVYRALVSAIDRTKEQGPTQQWAPPPTPKERFEAVQARIMGIAAPLAAKLVFAGFLLLLLYLAYTTTVAPHADNGITQIGTVEVLP